MLTITPTQLRSDPALVALAIPLIQPVLVSYGNDDVLVQKIMQLVNEYNPTTMGDEYLPRDVVDMLLLTALHEAVIANRSPKALLDHDYLVEIYQSEHASVIRTVVATLQLDSEVIIAQAEALYQAQLDKNSCWGINFCRWHLIVAPLLTLAKKLARGYSVFVHCIFYKKDEQVFNAIKDDISCASLLATIFLQQLFKELLNNQTFKPRINLDTSDILGSPNNFVLLAFAELYVQHNVWQLLPIVQGDLKLLEEVVNRVVPMQTQTKTVYYLTQQPMYGKHIHFCHVANIIDKIGNIASPKLFLKLLADQTVNIAIDNEVNSEILTVGQWSALIYTLNNSIQELKDLEPQEQIIGFVGSAFITDQYVRVYTQRNKKLVLLKKVPFVGSFTDLVINNNTDPQKITLHSQNLMIDVDITFADGDVFKHINIAQEYIIFLQQFTAQPLNLANQQ